MERIPLHPEDTPRKAYDRAMRFGAFPIAARLAQQYRLGRDLLIRALDRAMCRFEELGFPELADVVADELGFTIVRTTVAQLPQLARALEQISDGSMPTDRRSMN